MTNQTPTTIVVHPGAAHLDDFLTTCVALYMWPGVTKVERREPTPAELDSPLVGCLDVGNRHEPELFNFDHHQLGRDDAPACALSLFAESTTIHLADGDVRLSDAFDLTHWYHVLKTTDSKGPVVAARSIGVTPDQFMQIHANPLSGAILQLFKDSSELSSMDLQMMRTLGGLICDFAVDLYVRVNFELAEAVTIKSLPDNDVMILESSDNRGLNLYRERHCPGVTVSVMHDDRGPGWTLYRFDDHPWVDFSKLQGEQRILFAHKGGFIAKTKERIPLHEVMELIEAAHVDATLP